MSDEQEWQQAQPPVAEGPTAGTLLRRAREASGLHVAALAVSLKVPVRKLEALEDDRHEEMTDAVFIRGLASSVCRALKIDPQPILERLPQTSAPRLVRNSDGLNAPFRAPSDGAPPSWVDQLTRPVFLAVFTLLLGALVIILLPGVQMDDKPALPAPATATQKPAAAPVFVPVTPAPEPVAVSPAPPPAPAAAAVPGPAAAVVASPAPATATPASGTVVIRAKGESWVEVTDAKGAVAVRKILIPGEAAAASGALPLQVTIGRVDAIEVQVRGRPFDLRPVSRDNVARFEVK